MKNKNILSYMMVPFPHFWYYLIINILYCWSISNEQRFEIPYWPFLMKTFSDTGCFLFLSFIVSLTEHKHIVMVPFKWKKKLSYWMVPFPLSSLSSLSFYVNFIGLKRILMVYEDDKKLVGSFKMKNVLSSRMVLFPPFFTFSHCDINWI